MYNPSYFETLCPVLARCLPGFNAREFIFRVFNNAWPDMELKERVRHISTVLHHFLDQDFTRAASQVVDISRALMNASRRQAFENIFLPDYIEVYGCDHPDASLDALGEVTQLVSAEFAVRPFIQRYTGKALSYAHRWSKSANPSVRRLSSEGFRPRLPWAIALPAFKADPGPVLPILERLKKDPSEYVRKSVANHINDIAKDNPEIVLRLAEAWRGKHPHTDWIIRHGCRTLLKRGNTQALSLHGFAPGRKAQVSDLRLPQRVRIGDDLHFSFVFKSREAQPTPFRLEYAIDYVTSTGRRSRKVFKLTENTFLPGQTVEIKRKQSFRNLTTRKHFPGKHGISILANGKEHARGEFTLD